MQPPDLAGVTLAFGFQRRPAAKPEIRASQRSANGSVGDDVGAPEPLQLQAMLDAAQEAYAAASVTASTRPT